MRAPGSQCRWGWVLLWTAVGLYAQTDKPRLRPEVKSALKSALPKFTPPAPSPAKSLFVDPADSDLLVLPTVTVKSRKLTSDDVLTLNGKVDAWMDTYLGSKNGFDRGFMNKIPLNWQVGPGRFSLFGAETNETRALEARFDDNRLRHREDLLRTSAVLEASGDAEKAKWLRRESTDLFYRKPDIRRRR